MARASAIRRRSGLEGLKSRVLPGYWQAAFRGLLSRREPRVAAAAAADHLKTFLTDGSIHARRKPSPDLRRDNDEGWSVPI